MPSATGIWENLLFCMGRWVGKHRHPMEEKISMAKEKQHCMHAILSGFEISSSHTFWWLCFYGFVRQSGSAWDRRHRQPHTQHTRSSNLRWSLAHPAPPQPPRAQRAARRRLRPPGLRRHGEPRHGVLERRGAANVAVPLRGAGGATGGAAAVHWRTLEWQDEAMGRLVRNLGRFIGSIISDMLV